MRVNPIPKSLLRHGCNLLKRTKDAWGDATHTITTAIKRVRIEPTSKIVVTKENQELQLTALMFYDCVNSIPRNVVFSPDGDVVVFDNKEYAVKSVDVLYAEKDTPHHYEIGLV